MNRKNHLKMQIYAIFLKRSWKKIKLKIKSIAKLEAVVITQLNIEVLLT